MMSVVTKPPILPGFPTDGNPFMTRHIFAPGDLVNPAARSAGQMRFSRPLSRSPTPAPDVTPSAAEVEPRIIGKKTAEFFGFPSYPSSHQETMKVDTELDPTPSNPLDRPPSPVRPHSLTYSFFFEQNRPSALKFSGKHPLRLPPIELFFPSRLCRPPGTKVNHWDDEYGRPMTLPEFSVVNTFPQTEKGLQDQRPHVPPPLKINSEFFTESRRSFPDSALDDLPSMFSSPIPSSPVHDSPTPITSSPLGSPRLPTHEESPDESLEPYNLQESSGPVPLAEGVIVGSEPPLLLIRILGLGAFSSVWLARDILHKLGSVGTRPKIPFKRDEVGALKKGDRTGHGLRPPLPTALKGSQIGRSTSVYFKARNALADSNASVRYMTKDAQDHGRLVAVKMMERTLCDNDDRTRISFMREVEILRHISHPSIVSYLHSFSTSTHHCIVLEAVLGGELMELICQGDNFTQMTEPLIRRIFGELCHAISWMHSVGLVHRDVKLENILCTMNPFLPNTVLPPPSAPLIKLTDFGLARFIDPADPLLTTRCGSDSYAAPEIILCKPYDGRQTDAWACGVVLFALATCFLPFDKPGGGDTRRALLSRIARVDYSWPEVAPLATDGLRSVVHSFLVRSLAGRTSVTDIWDNSWMHGEGAPPPPAPGATLVSSGQISRVAREETV